MKIIKILNIKEPISNNPKHPSPYDCYDITVDFGDGKPFLMVKNRLGYEVFKLEQELLSKGVDPDLLDKYHSAIIDETEFDSNQD